MKSSIWCRLGLHDDIKCESEAVIAPMRGPLDPRDAAQRTSIVKMEICTQCGRKRTVGYEFSNTPI